MSDRQCIDLNADRELGKKWERNYCILAAKHGKCFTPHQIGRSQSAVAYKYDKKWKILTLPDVTIWTAPGEHHEIKHKNPDKSGCYGLEVYRFDILVEFAKETGQAIFYTIHDHDKAGGKLIEVNNINHWVTANIVELINRQQRTKKGYSWVNGKKELVDIHYWPSNLFQLLRNLWGV